MIRLNEKQIAGKSDFVRQYMENMNAADCSKLDANANVSAKNISTLESEIHKDINIQLNRHLVQTKIRSLFGDELAAEYARQIEAHEIYVHDETSLKPYCVSISMYPFLLDGITSLGGESKAPQNMSSFCGSFINLIFAISAQFAGAVATVEFLTYFDHFARRDWGDDYLSKNEKSVRAYFQQVVYSLNQPAAARGYQSVFWNISLYDRHYFESLFEGFVFPNGDTPQWASVEPLQEYFMRWFNQEREKALLTFPVVTVAMLTENNRVKNRQFADFYARELAQGNSFFVYLSDTPDSLASCCRLRNEISNQGFSYSLGAGGVATGSLNVITINMNRLVQNGRSLRTQVENIHKYQVAYRRLMEDFKAAGLLPVYDAGYISFDKQYLTIGINGMVEAAEYLNIPVSDNEDYKSFLKKNLQVIYELNKKARAEYGYMFNTEFVPAENLGVKNAKWDKRDGLKVGRDCYNSYFYAVEDESIDFIDKFQLHGRDVIQYLDGGSALHLNLEEYLTPAQYMLLLDNAARIGCNYFCTNVKVTVCNECTKVTKRTQTTCSFCGSDHVDYATRVIGYLKRVSSFSSARQKEHDRRFYHLDSVYKGFEKDIRRPATEPATSGYPGF
ncbi:MAG: anaerobic ribonucleoside-triphosphate reductase [Bdellovibrionaceae bacterium]|nr:anaerobic ribonucleoside-triphosphate reductase [Pseudobdellovibrionaceae bacterium]